MTHDLYYDEKPYFNKDGTKIIFASKRTHKDFFSGLTEKSDLYSINLDGTGLIKIIDHDSIPFFEFTGFKKNSNGIVLLQKINDSYSVIELNSLGKPINEFVPPNGFFSRMFYSPSGNYFATESLVESKSYHFTANLYDIRSDTYINFLSNKSDYDFGELDKVNCFPGSFIDNDSFLINCSSYKKKISKMYTYSISTDQLTTITTFKKIRPYNPVLGSGSSLVYSISDHFYQENDQNIWMYNMENANLVKITDSKTEKEWLQVF